jgi:Spy/CpxP family protein refolding chaperone
MILRLILAIAALSVASAQAELPAPWAGQGSFWDNPEAIKKLKLTDEQRRGMSVILQKANAQVQQEIRAKLTPEQLKQIQSLHTDQSEAGARMGLGGPDAQRVASALRVGRVTAQNYSILMDMTLGQAVSIGAELVSSLRGITTDPCKTTSDALLMSAPQFDSAQVKVTLTLNGKTYPGNSCPSATADLLQDKPATVKATYPCAVTVQGVDLAPGCRFERAVTALVR